MGRHKTTRVPTHIGLLDRGVYAITCTPTGSVYIGQSRRIRERLNMHMRELHLQRHRCPLLQEQYNAHGPLAFSFAVLELVHGTTEAREIREAHWIHAHRRGGCPLLNGLQPNTAEASRVKALEAQ